VQDVIKISVFVDPDFLDVRFVMNKSTIVDVRLIVRNANELIKTVSVAINA